MNCLTFSGLNVNSLVRSNSSNKFSCPYLNFLKKTSDIVLLSDVRVCSIKKAFLNESLSYTDQINVKRQRFFSTESGNYKTGGAGIYISPVYDEILKVIYCRPDTADIPRFVTIVCSVTGGPLIMITAFYGSPGKTSEKSKVFRRLYNHIYDLTNKYSSSLHIFAGDINLNLSNLCESKSDHSAFIKILTDFLLVDAFSACPADLDKQDAMRLQKQDLIPHHSQEGNTYHPKIAANQKSRLDGIFFSSSLEHHLLKKSFCLALPHPFSDHFSVHLSLVWSLSGVPLGKNRPSFIFRNHLISDSNFTKLLKRDIATTILCHYRRMGGFLDRKTTDKITLNHLESLLFDRLKNDSTVSFSPIDLFYEILEKIEKTQNLFLKRRTSKEKSRQTQLIEKIASLEKIKNPRRSERKLFNAASAELQDIQKKQLRRQSLDSNLDYNTLGDAGTRYFLRSKVIKRSKTFVRTLEKSDGQFLHNSFEIEEVFFEHFKSILETPDPFDQKLFESFIEPVKNCFGMICRSDREAFDCEISVQELSLAVKNIRSSVAPGGDGCTGKLLIYLFSFIPRVICKGINEQVLQGLCSDKPLMERRIICIPKPNSTKQTIKRFRPISLLSSLYKLADSCIVARLVAALENNKILPPYAFAYRRGLSSTDAILSLQAFIENANHTDRKLLILNFDISSAFDLCSRELAIALLRLLLFGPEATNHPTAVDHFLIRAIRKLPTGAIARICVNLAESRFPGISAPFACPQGAASSGVIFGLACLVLLTRINHHDVALFKLDLSIPKKITPCEAFIETEWMKVDRSHSKVTTEFKATTRQKWLNLSKKEQADFKKTMKKRFYDEATIRLKNIASTISFSDDGHVLLSFDKMSDIFFVIEIFKQFGNFSGLRINTDKTRIVSVNFSFSADEIRYLTDRGFDRDMITGEHTTFRFLGCDIKAGALKQGAIVRMNQLCNEMENIAKAFDSKDCTLQGRRAVCQTLMTSRLQTALTAFNLNQSDTKKIQKIINNFVYKKKLSAAGKRKHMSFSKGGLQIPSFFEKHLISRTNLLKGLFSRIENNQTIPLWGEVLIQALKFIGFPSTKLLGRSLGLADIRFIIKNLNELGFFSLANLFKSAEIIQSSFEKRRSGKNQSKTSHSSSDPPCLSIRKDLDGNIVNLKDIGHRDKFGFWKNMPDPPLYRSCSLIGNPDDDCLMRRNKKTLYSVWSDMQPNFCIPAFEYSARNVLMSPWILNYLASPNVLLDANNNPSSDSKLTPIVNMSSKQRVLCETLTERAQEFCKEKFATMGPASPIHSPNPFIRWFASCTTNSNTKSIFY